MQEEIIKHMKRAIAVVNDPHSSLWKKAREIFLEVGIIVFAVSVSISLHTWNTNRQQHTEMREFLSDLKEDLAKDRKNLETEKKRLDGALLAIQQIKGLTPERLANVQSFEVTVHLINRKTFSGNYEGFKSSGKIGYIKNKQLKSAILAYYQETMPSLDEVEQFRNKKGIEIVELLGDANLKAHQFIDPRMRTRLNFVEQATVSLIEAYTSCLQQAAVISAEIDKELGKR
ncbi:MAG: DUF6090 family protein [Turneriella sp.]